MIVDRMLISLFVMPRQALSSPDWTDPLNLGVPGTQVDREACGTAAHVVTKILVEEWDGYTWRRVLGNGPMPGRDVLNVAISDVLPPELVWGGFLGTAPAGATLAYNAGTRTVSMNMPLLQVQQSGSFSFWATAQPAGWAGYQATPFNYLSCNTATMGATNEAPVASAACVTITSSVVPPPTPGPSSLTKTANASNFNNGAPITYTLAYTNTDGTVATPALSSATGWTNRSTAPAFNFTAGGLTYVTKQADKFIKIQGKRQTQALLTTRVVWWVVSFLHTHLRRLPSHDAASQSSASGPMAATDRKARGERAIDRRVLPTRECLGAQFLCLETESSPGGSPAA